MPGCRQLNPTEDDRALLSLTDLDRLRQVELRRVEVGLAARAMWNVVKDAAGPTQRSSTQLAGDNRGGRSWSETVDLSQPQPSATVV